MKRDKDWPITGERSPRYNLDRREFRVASFPNQQWQAQEYKPLTDGNGNVVRDKTIDPWIPLHRPTSLATALQQRDTHAVRRAG